MSAALSGTIGRWQLRAAAAAVLKNQTSAGQYVYTSRDTEQAPDDVPAIRIYAPLKDAAWRGGSPPVYAAKVTLVIVADVSGISLAACEAAADLLADQIEFALLCNVSFMGMLTRVSKHTMQVKHEVKGDRHMGTITMAVDCEYVDRFPPNLTLPNAADYIGGNTLTTMTVRADMATPFDANLSVPDAGTLDNGVTLAVPPAPRISGPDGRVDIGADIDILI